MLKPAAPVMLKANFMKEPFTGLRPWNGDKIEFGHGHYMSIREGVRDKKGQFRFQIRSFVEDRANTALTAQSDYFNSKASLLEALQSEGVPLAFFDPANADWDQCREPVGIVGLQALTAG